MVLFICQTIYIVYVYLTKCAVHIGDWFMKSRSPICGNNLILNLFNSIWMYHPMYVVKTMSCKIWIDGGFHFEKGLLTWKWFLIFVIYMIKKMKIKLRFNHNSVSEMSLKWLFQTSLSLQWKCINLYDIVNFKCTHL